MTRNKKFSNPNIQSSQAKSDDKVWLQEFNFYLEQNLSSDLLTVPYVARVFNMSESTLLRKVKQLTGQSPIQYIQEYRLFKGKQLLDAKIYDSVTRIAIAVGYKDVRSFSRLFKKRFGYYPSEK